MQPLAVFFTVLRNFMSITHPYFNFDTILRLISQYNSTSLMFSTYWKNSSLNRFISPCFENSDPSVFETCYFGFDLEFCNVALGFRIVWVV